MGFYQDNLLPFFKKRQLTFKESYKLSDDVHSFLFEGEGDLTWHAGQYGLFSITHKPIKNATRPFSVASAPAENTIQITTRIHDNASDFKKALLELEPGMTVSMRGPVGPFYLQDSRPALLIAGGIGITPFRSILKQLELTGNRGDIPIHLVYLDSKRSYIFRDELDAVASHPSIRITYVDSSDDLHQEIDKFASMYDNNGIYFIAGPKSMTESCLAYLGGKSISKRNIRKDVFFGY